MNVRRKLAVLAAIGLSVVAATSANATTTGSDTTQGAAAGTLKVGVTHTQQTFWGDPDGADQPESIKGAGRAGDILSSVGPLQGVHLMGWGPGVPTPSPGVYNWGDLDSKINVTIAKSGGQPVLILCCAPGWMTGGDDWPDAPLAPKKEYFDDYAKLSAEAAKRYPQVKNFLVWNELKGFWNEAENRWDYEGYTDFYNQVYTAVKAVRPDAKIGGPYSTTDIRSEPTGDRAVPVSDWGYLDDRNLDSIKFWYDHKVGADFVVVDGGTERSDDGYSPTDPVKAAAGYQAMIRWLKTNTPGLPIWYAEFYVWGNGIPASSYLERFKTVLNTMDTEGVSTAMMWYPECPGATVDEVPCLWTSTSDETNGGKATEYVPVVKQYLGVPQ